MYGNRENAFAVTVTIAVIILFGLRSSALSRDTARPGQQSITQHSIPPSTATNSDTSKTRKILQKLLDQAKSEIEQEVTKPKKGATLEVDGLIFNETKTKLGQDFYDLFFTSWEAPPMIRDFHITILEKGAGTWGSWIVVEVNESAVYQNRLTPRLEEVEQAVSESLHYVIDFLYNYEAYQKQLTGEDLKGTGIY